MLNRIKYLIILFFTLFFFNLLAQEGRPLANNFAFGKTNIDNESWVMTHYHKQQMMYVNKRGVFSFEGFNRSTILTPSVPLSFFYNDNSNQIIIGCKNNIGLLIIGEDALCTYDFLFIDQRNLGEVKVITDLNRDVYSTDFITCFNLTTKKNTQWAAESVKPYTCFFNNKAFVYAEDKSCKIPKLC